MLATIEPPPQDQRCAPFEVCLRSTQLSVRRALKDFMGALSPLRLTTEERGVVELVLAEVLNNIVKHAYGNQDAAGPIRIKCSHDHNGLIVQVVDQGAAMQGDDAPFRDAPTVDCSISDLPEGGFGWFLIRDLTKDVTYQRRGQHNCLTLRLAIATQT